MTPFTIICIGLINWFATFVLVEGHIFQTPRMWVVNKGMYALDPRSGWHPLPYVHPEGTTQEQADAVKPYPYGWRGKCAQLVTCAACTRTWVGFAQAAYFGGPFGGWAAIVANGLLYAALGHLIYELRSRVALVLPTETA